MNGASREDAFRETMKGLENGVQVRLIASDVVTCDAEDAADEVLSRSDLQDFSHIPVRREGRICGVLDRGNVSRAGAAGQRMTPLDESFLIAAAAPIDTFIHALGNSDYRLVVDCDGIVAIVTRSDLQKLPVRCLAFTVITHLEMFDDGPDPEDVPERVVLPA